MGYGIFLIEGQIKILKVTYRLSNEYGVDKENQLH
jgi:hypothetical protein